MCWWPPTPYEAATTRNNVFKDVRLELANQALHALRFKLKHGGGFTLLEQVKTFLVGQRNGGDIDRLGAARNNARINRFHGPVDNGQGFQTEKVELDQTSCFNVILVVLGNQTLAQFITMQRRKVGELARGDYHTTGMLADVTGQAFELEGHLPDFPNRVPIITGTGQ